MTRIINLLVVLILCIIPSCKKEEEKKLNLCNIDKALLKLDETFDQKFEYKGYSNLTKRHYYVSNKAIKVPPDSYKHRSDRKFEDEIVGDVVNLIPAQSGKCDFYDMSLDVSGHRLLLGAWIFKDSTVIGVELP